MPSKNNNKPAPLAVENPNLKRGTLSSPSSSALFAAGHSSSNESIASMVSPTFDSDEDRTPKPKAAPSSSFGRCCTIL